MLQGRSNKRVRAVLTGAIAAAMIMAPSFLTVTPVSAVNGDPVCTPGSGGTTTGLTNVGFESGDFTGWTFGTVTEEICVTGPDAFTAPYEGTHMARLGKSQPSNDPDQPQGPNELRQTFLVDQPLEKFAYNIFTYDYTGYDNFQYRVTVTDGSGTVIAGFQRGAWGSSGNTDLKTSGWQYATVNLAGHIGQTVTLSISAGGTRDTLYAFWAYVDSAESGAPTPVAPISSVFASTASVTTDPQSGQINILMNYSNRSDLTITSQVACPDGLPPIEVNLLLAGSRFQMNETTGGSGLYTATIPALQVVSGPLSIEVVCNSGTYVTPEGTVSLYDPSGDVTNAITGAPIKGATVTLYSVPGWTPGPGGAAASQCQNDGGPWTQPAPEGLGVLVSPYGDESDGGNANIEPDVNPFVTDVDGHYGWDVAEGCWYVKVAAAGYVTRTSAVVGVPPAVTTLDIALVPEGSGFEALTPARVFDTRVGEPQGAVSVTKQQYGGANVLKVKVTGVAGVPTSGVGAVSLNVTVAGPVGAGFVTVFPCGDRPLAANLNYVAGQIVPNAVIAPVSPSGEVCFFSMVNADLIADVNGWFASGAGFDALTPARVFDTRVGEPQGAVSVTKQQYGGANVLKVKVTGVAGVPTSGVGAVSLNVTVAGPVGAGFVTVFPCGDRPLAANLNYVAGQIVPNAVIAPVSPSGEVCFFSMVNADLIADVNGWFASGAGFDALTPARVFDTRVGEPQGAVSVTKQQYGGANVLKVKVTGVAGVPTSGVGAVSLNVTVAGPVGAGFVTVFPCGDRPLAANLNYVAGQIVPNAVIAPVSPSGEVCFFSMVNADLIADVNGWFAG